MTFEDIEKRIAEIRGRVMPGIRTGMGELRAPKAEPVIPTPTPRVEAGVREEVGARALGVGGYDLSKFWETEYAEAGLEDVKTKIAGIDTDITARKTARDQALLDEKGKPIPQWMITGRKELEIEAATGDLNRLIDERNTLAGQYNIGIEEVTRKVGFEEKRLKAMAEELERETGAERWEKEFGLKLEEARAPETSTITYETGGRQYRETFNAITGELIKREDLGAVTPKEPARGKAPEDIETYAQMRLRGEIGTGGVPADIRTEVERRYRELMTTEKTWELDEIRAWIRSQIRALEAEDVTITTDQIEVALRDTILTDKTLTDTDRSSFNLILGEIMGSKPAGKPEVKGGLGKWLREEVKPKTWF